MFELIFRRKSYMLIFTTKTGLDYNLGEFFKNASGQPGYHSFQAWLSLVFGSQGCLLRSFF
jgi:hypothetical protein